MSHLSALLHRSGIHTTSSGVYVARAQSACMWIHLHPIHITVSVHLAPFTSVRSFVIYPAYQDVNPIISSYYIAPHMYRRLTSMPILRLHGIVATCCDLLMLSAVGNAIRYCNLKHPLSQSLIHQPACAVACLAYCTSNTPPRDTTDSKQTQN